MSSLSGEPNTGPPDMETLHRVVFRTTLMVLEFGHEDLLTLPPSTRHVGVGVGALARAEGTPKLIESSHTALEVKPGWCGLILACHLGKRIRPIFSSLVKTVFGKERNVAIITYTQDRYNRARLAVYPTSKLSKWCC